ncbi:afadin- and alpha-actinin-binding protein A-like [Limulus polyphemus]|uniref:Afadin- and alpha-actinin-binding protein A-like n=1 Tax=Limulus polyphemus TaxID=6850 RepID=A0ABM1BFI8_LIMPO|nr:afadin- and alpha-actinin-binding protein A-like [Limulus polyphemus]
MADESGIPSGLEQYLPPVYCSSDKCTEDNIPFESSFPVEAPNDSCAYSFCSKENIHQSLSFLARELSNIGFPTIKINGSSKFDIIQLVNATYDLLQLNKQNIKLRDDLEYRHLRTSSDLDQVHNSQNRLREELEQNKRTVSFCQEKERQLLIKNKDLQIKLKAEKDEVKRLTSIIQQKHAQYHHDLRKKEREINQLKERLHQSFNDKGLEKRLGIDIINQLPRKDGRRGQWKTELKTNLQEEQLQQVVLANYESRYQELMEENAKLRDSLCYLQDQLQALLDQPLECEENHNGVKKEEEDFSEVKLHCSSATSRNILPSPHFQMPYNIVCSKIEEIISTKCEKIKELLKEKNNNFAMKEATQEEKNLNSEIQALREKIKKCEQIIDQQEQLLQVNVNAEETQSHKLKGGHILDEEERFLEEKNFFMEQKRHFDEEREVFTEAVIRLGRERQAFQLEKAEFMKTQFLALKTPSRAESQLNPGTPLFTSPDGRVHPLPSTPELYHMLSITPLSGTRVRRKKNRGKKGEDSSNNEISWPLLKRENLQNDNLSLGSDQSHEESTSNYRKLSIDQHIDGLKMAMFQCKSKSEVLASE